MEPVREHRITRPPRPRSRHARPRPLRHPPLSQPDRTARADRPEVGAAAPAHVEITRATVEQIKTIVARLENDYPKGVPEGRIVDVVLNAGHLAHRAWPRMRIDDASRVFLVFGAALAFVGGSMLRAAVGG